MPQSAAVIWADGPISMPSQPYKPDIRAWGMWVESILGSISANAGTIFGTQALLNANLNFAANTLAWVVQDTTVANNGIYLKSGASGAGSWARVADLPYSWIKATDTGTGTPSSIVATTSIPLSNSAVVYMVLSQTNDESPVTVTFNGGSALTIKTNSGANPSVGGLVAGMGIWGLVADDEYRLVSDEVAAAIVASCEAIRDQAQTIVNEAALGIVPDGSVTPAKLQNWNIAPGGRLSLTAGVAFPSSDVATATTVYYIPVSGNYCPIFDGTKFLAKEISDTTALVLDATAAHAGYHQSGRIFDFFAYDAGSGVIGIGTGPGWASDTARGTGVGTTELEVYKGVLVAKNSITLRIGSASGNTLALAARRATYIGSFRTVADGQAADALAQRFLFNPFNTSDKDMFQGGATANYSYGTAAWRAIGGVTTRKMEFLLGLTGIRVEARARTMVQNSSATLRQARSGIALDSLTVLSSDALSDTVMVGSDIKALGSEYSGYPGLGYHYLQQIEYADGSDTQTFFVLNAGVYKGGMKGRFLA